MTLVNLILRYSFIVFVALLFISKNAGAQNTPPSKHIIYFTDKVGVSFNPYQYFDSKAIERRIKHGLSLYDSSDFPVNDNYIKTIIPYIDSITFISRWFNAAFVYVSPQNLKSIEELKCVKKIEPLNTTFVGVASTNETNTAYDIEDLEIAQLQRFGTQEFWAKGITGKGVRIAVFDIGFKNYKTHEAFEYLRKNNRILKTYDFMRNKSEIDGYNWHGTAVLSCIAGYDLTDSTHYGMAYDAEFLLAITEVNREPFKEEEAWLAAAEWADKNGADIINSSLGYTHHRYFKSDMTGKKTFVTKAAEIANNKGILVVNSAGNEGDNSDWLIVGAPADSDSVLSIGGIDPQTGYRISFSSLGPNFSGNLKPNLTAYGEVMLAKGNIITTSTGTSFSSPLVAGFAACVLQAKPNYKVFNLRTDLQKSGDLYPYYDYMHGFGVPQASYFLRPPNAPSVNDVNWYSLENKDNQVFVNLMVESINSKNNTFSNFVLGWEDYFLYHLADSSGKILFHAILEPNDTKTFELDYLDISESIDNTRPLYLKTFFRNQVQTLIINE